MRLSPGQRRFVLTLHVTSTVGWLGSTTVFLALGVIGLTNDDPATVRGVYLVMEPAAWLVLMPLAGASLATGMFQSLSSPWGLFNHYWVLFKLLITVVATLVLVIYMQTFSAMAYAAGDPERDVAALRNFSPVLHASLALIGLTGAAVLSIYKPRGLTPFGEKRREGR